MARDTQGHRGHDGAMFAPYCPTCRTHRLLGYGRVVRSDWERGGVIELRCHCGTVVVGRSGHPDSRYRGLGQGVSATAPDRRCRMGAARIPRSVVWPGLMAVAGGATFAEAAALVGVSVNTLRRRAAEEAVVVVRQRQQRPDALTLDERVEIAVGIGVGESDGQIAGRLGRHRSTVWREIRLNGGRSAYRAFRPRSAPISRPPPEAALDRGAAVAVGRGVPVDPRGAMVAEGDRSSVASGASR